MCEAYDKLWFLEVSCCLNKLKHNMQKICCSIMILCEEFIVFKKNPEWES